MNGACEVLVSGSIIFLFKIQTDPALSHQWRDQVRVQPRNLGQLFLALGSRDSVPAKSGRDKTTQSPRGPQIRIQKFQNQKRQFQFLRPSAKPSGLGETRPPTAFASSTMAIKLSRLRQKNEFFDMVSQGSAPFSHRKKKMNQCPGAAKLQRQCIETKLLVMADVGCAYDPKVFVSLLHPIYINESG